MPKFAYTARNQQGQLIKGSREAETSEIVATQLLTEGIIPIQISKIKALSNASLSNITLFWGAKVPRDDIMMFCRQMYSLYKAGIPLATAVVRLAETTSNPTFADTLHSVARDLASGRTLSNAMLDFPKVFPNLVVKLIRVGEESAQLDEVFAAAADYLELETKTRNRISAVLRYPIFVLVAITGAVTVINFFVIPVFAQLFERFHAQLPLPTRILIAVSHFTTTYWYLILGFSLAVIYIIRKSVQTKQGRFIWNKYQLRVPIIGHVIMLIIMARFAKTFSIIIRAGIPITEGIVLVAGTTNNVYASERILLMKEIVEQGGTLTSAAASSKLFTPLILQMLAVGEETGHLDKMLDEVSLFYEHEVEFNIKKLADRMEPVLLIAIAGLVLLLALSVFLPMWDMIKIAR